ncbi:MAG: GPP34 family phosphoprotein [Acetobacteraceae bacterium]
MKHLTLADEIVVLMLDDTVGEIKPGCMSVAGVAIAGGILMELALLGRIDTDLKSLYIVNPEPVGDALLDATLKEIAAEPAQQPSAWWIDQLSTRHGDFVEQILGRLVASGILREEERRFLWVFSRRAYPQVSGREEREAKARLMQVLFNDEVPDPRDTLLLGLAKSTGVLSAILTADELDKATPRINEVAALEEIGRSVGLVATQVRDAVASIMMAHYP